MNWPAPFMHLSVWGCEPYLLYYDRPLSFISRDSQTNQPHLFLYVEDDRKAQRERFLAVPVLEGRVKELLEDTVPYSLVCQESSGPVWVLTADYKNTRTYASQRPKDEVPFDWWPTDTWEDCAQPCAHGSGC